MTVMKFSSVDLGRTSGAEREFSNATRIKKALRRPGNALSKWRRSSGETNVQYRTHTVSMLRCHLRTSEA